MKDENLKIAKAHGFRVPDFFVVSADEVFHDTAALRAALPTRDATALQDILRRGSAFTGSIPLAGERFAVRSACTMEDGSEASFAGQFDTFLDVPRAEVPACIVRCMASLYSRNVLDYAAAHAVPLAALRMNVIVQEMVPSELSGVLFTANPQGLLNEMVIVVGRGQGAGVVSDRTETTTYYRSTTDRITYYEGRENLLTAAQLTELTQQSERLCAVFHRELLDLEFAIADEKIYLLQVREITTLSADKPTILDNSNIVESYPGISLPLTDSFVNYVYSGVFRGLASRVLKNDAVVAQYADTFRSMVGSANGRMYYKISNWYTVIKFLPLRKKIIPIWQEMLGVRNKTYDDTAVPLSRAARARTYVNAVWELLRVPHNMQRLDRTFHAVCDDFYAKFNDRLTAAELLCLYEEIRSRLLCVWDLTLLNDMYAFLFTGAVKALLKKKAPADAEKIAGDYLSGISNIESMKPIRALAALAAAARKDRDSAQFRQQYDEFLRLYGDRYLEELKLESRTFRTDPTLLDEKIDEYLRDDARLMRLLQPEPKTKTLPVRGIRLSFCVRRAVLGIRNREISRLNRSRIFGMVRGIFLALGKIYAAQGLLTAQTDIFYLTMEEAFALAETPVRQQALVTRRKAEYEKYALLPAYSRLVFAGAEYNKHPTQVNGVACACATGQLCGIPCSGGRATGAVLLVTNPAAVTDVSGKILVTKMTDPGWVFLLAGAAGIVAEKGSLLSHTAIVSREIGIPSVVGVENAMQLLRDGEIITLDGSTGTIEREVHAG